MRYPMTLFLSLLLCCCALGCGQLEEHANERQMKSRATPLPTDSWAMVEPQDIAILLPRVWGEGISANTPTEAGEWLLKPEWLQAVSRGFEPTDVADALERENLLEEWEAVAIRVAPCSPFGTIPGAIADELCWPEVRIVWQPTQYDEYVDWLSIWVEAISDDRAIHALYRVYPPGHRAEVDALIKRLGATNAPSAEDLARLDELRRPAISQLLGDVLHLRTPNADFGTYGALDLRFESMDSDEMAASFYGRLADFLGHYAMGNNLHTMTAFSLPEGRQPAIMDIWTFIAFDGVDGEVVQRDITVADPETGETVIEYGSDETVAAANADHRIQDALDEGENAEFIRRQILTEPADRERLRHRINDPSQTLVANTSCATCHSFNELTFDFHNLSYFQERDITIAERVRNDVVADLTWLRRR